LALFIDHASETPYLMEAFVPALSFFDLKGSTDPFAAYKFSTKLLRPEDQFDAWRSPFAETIDLLPTAHASEMFEAEFSCWAFEDIIFTRAIYADAPARRWQHLQRSFMGHWCVVLARSDDRSRDSLSLADPRHHSLSFRSLALPFMGEARDTEVLTLFLPRDSWCDELEDFERARGRDINPELGALLAGYMDGLARQLPHIGREHAHRLAVATRSLVAACIAPRAERLEAAEAPIASLLIDRARLVIRQNMASPKFGPEQLARLMAMSRSKLYRLFESTGGVAHFINRERLREAQRRLSSPRAARSIHVIGSEVGFTDHSTFSRAFRREFGISPREARERSLATQAAQTLGFVFADAAPAGVSATRPPLG
jgi:AraC-like DNA-binding protein